MIVDNKVTEGDPNRPPGNSFGSPRSRRRLIGIPVAGLIAVLVVAACGRSPDGAGTRRELLVSAAASLTQAFRDMETAFERVSPETDVILNLAGSSRLREQILSGAPVGVLATANPDIMRQVAEAGYLQGPIRVFARNRMAIAVPEGNPGGVRGLRDLAEGELLVGLCVPTVPCGGFARRVLAGAGVQPVVDTEEPNVRALLTKVEASELDAAVVYATDVLGSDGVEGIPIPEAHNVVAEYPIAVVAGSPDPPSAEAFVSFVLSAEGRRILEQRGFSLP